MGMQRSEWVWDLFLESEPIGLADGWSVGYEGNRTPGGPLSRLEESWLGDGSASQEIFLAMFFGTVEWTYQAGTWMDEQRSRRVI